MYVAMYILQDGRYVTCYNMLSDIRKMHMIKKGKNATLMGGMSTTDIQDAKRVCRASHIVHNATVHTESP